MTARLKINLRYVIASEENERGDPSSMGLLLQGTKANEELSRLRHRRILYTKPHDLDCFVAIGSSQRREKPDPSMYPLRVMNIQEEYNKLRMTSSEEANRKFPFARSILY